jgi:Uma2 family endonuclease
MTAIPLQRDDVHYPESDGKPMAETEFHLDETIYLIDAFKDRFRDAQNVYVNGDMFLYYVEGDSKQVVAPDVFVVLGVAKRKRRIYKLWEEGRPPTLIVEVTSADTRRQDLTQKKVLYERLGVAEYILYDPLGDYLNPRIQGFRLAGGQYEPIPHPTRDSLESRVVGLTFRMEGSQLRLIDTATGDRLLRDEEVRELARTAEVRARTAEKRVRTVEERARAAEEEAARLKAELERLRGKGT